LNYSRCLFWKGGGEFLKVFGKLCTSDFYVLALLFLLLLAQIKGLSYVPGPAMSLEILGIPGKNT